MSSDRSMVARFVLAAGVLLVVLGEIPGMVGQDRMAWIIPLDALFHSSSIGGALVLAALGHVAGTALLSAREQGRAVVLYRLLTFALPLWALQLGVLVAATVTRWVDTLAHDAPITGGAWASVMTFRWNFWVADHMLEVPPEILGLTLFSIAVQLVALLALVVVVLPDRWVTGGVAALAGVTAIAVMALRARAVDFQDPYLLSLDTFSRSDAFLVGVLACCLARLGRRVDPSWSGAAVLVLIGGIFASGFVSTEQYLAVQLPVVALLAGLVLLDDGTVSGDWVLQPVVRSKEVDVLAATWSALVALAPLAATIVGRRTEMNWVLRVIVLLIALAIVVRVGRAVAERVHLPEQPISLTGLGETWRQVVAEADHDVRAGRAGRHARDADDDSGGSPPG